MESAAIHSSEVHEVDSGIPMILFKGFSTSLSLLQGELHLSHQAFLLRRKDVTALRCSEPLRFMVGGASKPCAMVWRDGTAGRQLADGTAGGESL